MNQLEGLKKSEIKDHHNAKVHYGIISQRGKELIINNKDEECLKFLKTVIQEGILGAFNAQVYMDFAVIFSNRDKYNYVIELLSGIKKDKMTVELYPALLALLGLAHLREGNFHQAIEIFHQALENNFPKIGIWNIHYDLGFCYLEIQKYPESKKHYQLALQNNPPKDKISIIEVELFSLKIKEIIAKIVGFFR